MSDRSTFAHWRNDLPASFVVFLVALPLCLGIALASGAPLISGLVAGVVGGLIVGALSGSPLGVSGPAAGLTAIVLTAIAELGGFEAFLVATMLAGAFQVAFGFLKAGVIAYYFPNSVIKGMLTGIGIIIVLKQIPHSVGYDKDYLGDESFIQPDQHNTFSELLYMTDALAPGAILITLVSLALMLLWDSKWVRNNAILSAVPGPLLAVIAGILMVKLFQSHATLAIGQEHLVRIPTINGLSDLPRPNYSAIFDPLVWKTALVIAVVASLETLLCTEATDKLDPQKRVTPTDRELKAQGAGNMLSGLLGGLPLTQVIVRSSANIQTGGRTKLSAILHGVLLLVAVLSIPGLLRMIPLASLAAILLMVGYKLIDPHRFVIYWKEGPMQFAPFLVTVLGVAFTDLLTGVGLGMAVAIVHILWKNYMVPYHHDSHRYKPGMPIYIELSEDVTFLNKAAIKRTLAALPDGCRVVLDASRNMDLHPDVKEIIEEFESTAKDRNISCEMLGFSNSRTMVGRSAP